MGRLSTQSALRRATRSSRSRGGVPAARASGARSRCGAWAHDVVAQTLGEGRDGKGKAPYLLKMAADSDPNPARGFDYVLNVFGLLARLEEIMCRLARSVKLEREQTS